MERVRFGASQLKLDSLCNNKSISLTPQEVLTACINMAFCSISMALSISVVIRRFPI